MQKQVLSSEQIELLPLIKEFKKDYYLVGGTAIALYLGHRRSIDFDLFTNKKIKRKQIKDVIQKFDYPTGKILFEADEQFHMIVNSVKITFFSFPHKIPAKEKFEDIINIPTLIDLSAMEAYALGGRAKWKDYVDLFFLLKDQFTLKQISQTADAIFTNFFNERLFREQLSYFKDIDYREEVEYMGTPIPEEEIKTFLTEVALQEF